ncbi:hypothetical protein [Chelativorans sp. J32]|uniref:hypothetical protein n=1 Tax=Chelativorans sp. J32 TaxID=935840 RepID=UPI000482AC48|nr:hypothetical protein [Chelativorans sp. J32]
MVNAGKALFSPSRSASFEQFILDSRGDTDTLIRYLQLRRQMLLRDCSQASLQHEDPADFLRVVGVIDDALRLVERIKQTDLHAVMEGLRHQRQVRDRTSEALQRAQA